ncbi:hypothetical protein ABZT02_23715 [Streptomyces sp. NPDC005402]|uniref:hypothetical protein n=1 Tax=Streptomyces sp. NPDC005402 TaxID=3155338 RepID=UPI0033B8B4DA
MAVEPARSASRVIVLISTHALENFEELIASSPAHGFLPKSALSAQAISRLAGRAAGRGGNAFAT